MTDSLRPRLSPPRPCLTGTGRGSDDDLPVDSLTGTPSEQAPVNRVSRGQIVADAGTALRSGIDVIIVPVEWINNRYLRCLQPSASSASPVYVPSGAPSLCMHGTAMLSGVGSSLEGIE